MNERYSRPSSLAALAILLMLTACGSANASAKGQEQVFEVSYQAVTNKLSALQLPPKAAPYKSFIRGQELVAGQSYKFSLPETDQTPVHGTLTTIVVTRVGPKSTRVQVTTTKFGMLFNRRDRQIEKQRLNELSRLLAGP